VLLVNPAAGAGRGRRRLPAVERALRAAGADYELVLTQSLEHGCVEAKRAVAIGAIPVVMSGDGLIGKVGGAIAGTGTPLGIIPGGRGNDLARVLGIPVDPAGAVGVLLAGETRTIDVGEANGARFLCIASCGFDSDANRIANEARLMKGPLVYAYAALRALLAWRPARFTLTAGGERRELTGYSVAAANSRAYGGGMFLAPEAELDDGLLDVVTTGEVSKLRFLRNLPSVFKGEHLDQEEVECFRTAELRIEADRPFGVYADGEHITDLPVTVRVLPAALRVIAPAAGA
jgi:YegS/Rv2252/BmrU family lipid kinase